MKPFPPWLLALGMATMTAIANGTAPVRMVGFTAAGPDSSGGDPVTPVPPGTTATFHAVVAEAWIPGLVPVFLVSTDGPPRLARLPDPGTENLSEPVFLALPVDDEPATAGVAGRWEVAATRAGQDNVRLAFELAVDASRLAGRFDPHSEHRFARIRDGSHDENSMDLVVEHVRDVFRIRVRRTGTGWAGTWRHDDGSEDGTLRLWRGTEAFQTPAGYDVVPLHAWRDPASGIQRTAPPGTPMPQGWIRSPRPICRVWIRRDGNATRHDPVSASNSGSAR